MPFPNFQGPLLPSLDAMLLTATSIQGLYNFDRPTQDRIAAVIGATVRVYRAAPDTFPVDVVVFQIGDDFLICLSGTTNSAQWLAHFGSAFVPVPSPFAGIMAVWSFQHGALQTLELIAPVITPLAGRKIYIAGHSYGGAVAEYLARVLLADESPPADVQVMTYGGPACFGAGQFPSEPSAFLRIIEVGDPVPLSPPASVYQATTRDVYSLLSRGTIPGWRQRGTPFYIENARLSLSDGRYVGTRATQLINLAIGSLVSSERHSMKDAYLRDVLTLWGAA